MLPVRSAIAANQAPTASVPSLEARDASPRLPPSIPADGKPHAPLPLAEPSPLQGTPDAPRPMLQSPTCVSLGSQAICSPDGRWVIYANHEREVFARQVVPEFADPIALGVRVSHLQNGGCSAGLKDHVAFASRSARAIIAAEDAVHIFDLGTQAKRVLSPWVHQEAPLLNLVLGMMLGCDSEQGYGRATLTQHGFGSMDIEEGVPGMGDTYIDLTNDDVIERPWPSASWGAGTLLCGGRWWVRTTENDSPITACRLDGEGWTQTLPALFKDATWIADAGWMLARSPDSHTMQLTDLSAPRLRPVTLQQPPPASESWMPDLAHASVPRDRLDDSGDSTDGDDSLERFEQRDRDGAFVFSGDRNVMYGCFSGALWRWRLDGGSEAPARMAALDGDIRPLAANCTGSVFIGAHKSSEDYFSNEGLVIYREGRGDSLRQVSTPIGGSSSSSIEDYALNPAGTRLARYADEYIDVLDVAADIPTTIWGTPWESSRTEVRYVADDVLIASGEEESRAWDFSRLV